MCINAALKSALLRKAVTPHSPTKSSVLAFRLYIIHLQCSPVDYCISPQIRLGFILIFAPKDTRELIMKGCLTFCMQSAFIHVQKSMFIQIQSCHRLLEYHNYSPNPEFQPELSMTQFL